MKHATPGMAEATKERPLESQQRVVTTDSESVNRGDDDICDLCANFPWEELCKPIEKENWTRPRWYDTPRVEAGWLENSTCRICRFLKSILAINGTFDLPSTLQQWNKLWEYTPQVSAWSFMTENRSESNRPHLIINPLDLKELQSLFDRVLPSVINFDYLRSRIQKCANDDLCVPNSQKSLVNFKVIDCERRIVTSVPTDCLYIALSYVWGPPSQSHEETYNMGAKLPQTIEDSITVTQILGYRYLWIDRYCIDQSSGRDKHDQIMQMADIYAAAQVTIIAAAGQDPNYGLPGVRRRSRNQMNFETVRGTHLCRFPLLSPTLGVNESNWASRAWTFQECFFSPRRLFFTDYQAIYICGWIESGIVEAETQWSSEEKGLLRTHLESALRGIVPALKVSNDDECLRMLMVFETLVAYSSRQLSYGTDALNAIVGALNTFTSQGIYHLWAVPFRLFAPEPEIAPSLISKRLEDSDSPLLPMDSNIVSLDDQAVGSGSSERPDHQASSQMVSNMISGKFEDTGSRLDNQGEMALLWRHMHPARRLHQFPSWSPLGWVGAIDGYRTLSFIRDGIPNNRYAMTPIDTIKVKSNASLVSISIDITQEFLRDTSTFSHCLQIISWTTDLWCSKQINESGLPQCVTIPLSDEFSLAFTPFWDDPSAGALAETMLKGLLLREANPKWEVKPESSDDYWRQFFVMVIQQKGPGTQYERKGIFRLPQELKYWYTTAPSLEVLGEDPDVEEPQFTRHPDLEEQDTTQLIYHCTKGSKRHAPKKGLHLWKDSETLNLPKIIQDLTATWWQQIFSPETIELV